MTQLTKITKNYSNHAPLMFIGAGLILLLGVILFHQDINRALATDHTNPSSIVAVTSPPLTIQKEVTTDQRNLTSRPPFPKDAGYSIQFLYNQTYPDPPFLTQE